MARVDRTALRAVLETPCDYALPMFGRLFVALVAACLALAGCQRATTGPLAPLPCAAGPATTASASKPVDSSAPKPTDGNAPRPTDPSGVANGGPGGAPPSELGTSPPSGAAIPDEAAVDPAEVPPPATPRRIWKVPVGASPVLGPADALVTIVVFSDFECPYCRGLARTLQKVRKKFGGDVRLVFKHAPLPFHARAEPAAQLALEAFGKGNHGRFWRLHDALFAAADLSEEELSDIAAASGLDAKAAAKAIASHRHRTAIEADEDLGASLGVEATPTSFVNGVRVEGALPVSELAAIVERELAEAKKLRDSGTPASKLYEAIVTKGEVVEVSPSVRVTPPVVTPGQPTLGPANAPVTIHIFTDFQCPFCARARGTLAALERRFRGRVRLVYHSLPLTPLHPDAFDAAQLALEAQAQRGNDGFWRAHDWLFASQEDLSREGLLDAAADLGLDVERARKALDEDIHAKAVEADLALAESLRLRGTPAFLVNGELIAGALPPGVFRRAVQRALAEAESVGKPGKDAKGRRAPQGRTP